MADSLLLGVTGTRRELGEPVGVRAYTHFPSYTTPILLSCCLLTTTTTTRYIVLSLSYVSIIQSRLSDKARVYYTVLQNVFKFPKVRYVHVHVWWGGKLNHLSMSYSLSNGTGTENIRIIQLRLKSSEKELYHNIVHASGSFCAAAPDYLEPPSWPSSSIYLSDSFNPFRRHFEMHLFQAPSNALRLHTPAPAIHFISYYSP